MFRAWVATALVASGCCCNSEPRFSRDESAPVVAPDGKVTATAIVAFSKGVSGVHGSTSDSVVHLLELRRGGETQRVQVARFLNGYLESSPAEFEEARKAKLKVTFAADGHVVSISADGGTTWKHVVLDVGAPFACGLSASSSGVPKTRDLLLADLRGAGFGKKRTCDLEGATRVLCAQGEDDELWGAALEQLLAHHLVDSERDPLLACLSPLVKRRPVLRDRLIAATAENDPERVGVAAEALAKSADAAAQAALALALEKTRPSDSEHCWSAAKLAWSLASITVERGEAASPVRKVLADLARAPPACPAALTGKAARVYAVAALGALKGDTLRELSATCTVERAPWTLGFTQWNEAMVGGLTDEPLECLAKALQPR